MNSNEAQEIEVTIGEFKHLIELDDALTRLKANPDFQLVFDNEYFKHEALRLVYAKGQGNVQSADAQRQITRDIDAIGSLLQFFMKINREADVAKRSLAEYQAHLDGMDGEELNDE